ncbi:MAG: hypothetical protein MHMPM18_003276, partial [Marteilia pararefringens]
ASVLFAIKIIAVLKEFDLKRHFTTMLDDFNVSQTAAGRKELFHTKRKNVLNMSNELNVHLNKNDLMTLAGFEVANLILKEGKPFSTGEFVESYIITAMDCLLSKDKDKNIIIDEIKGIPLR